MNPRRRLLVSALAAAGLAGCKVRTINDFPVTNAQVRVANVMLDASALDFIQGGVAQWPAVPFQGSADYLDFPNTNQTFFVRLTGTTADLTSLSQALAGDQPYTLVAFATVAQPFLLLVADVNITPGSGQTLSRFINAAYGSNAIDIYVTTPGVDLATVSPSFSAITATNSSSALQLSAGALQVRLTLSGSLVPIYDSGPLPFEAQASNTLVIYTIGSAFLPQLMFLENGGQDRQQVIPNTLASMRTVNGAFQTGAIDVLVDGQKVSDDVPYGEAATNQFVTAGARTVTYEASATPGATIATLQRTFTSATDSSVLVYGYAGAVQAVAFDDDNRVPIEGQARLRFINGSSDDAAYDVYIGDARAVAALAPRAASVYFSLQGDNYTITFRNPATGAIVATIADAGIPSGGVLTAYCVGIAADLDTILVASR